MIARISGILIDKSVNHIVVDNNGIGFRIFVPLTTFYELPETNQPVTLHIHTHVKQDSIGLFGFNSIAEKDLFQLMISISGIGPKLALNILSGITVDELIHAVSDGDAHRLFSIPGVGRKTADRMILELRDKVSKIVPDTLKYERGGRVKEIEQLKEDAASALINLGYKSSIVHDALDKIIGASSGEISTLDVLLKKALRSLSG
jgi:Holliday junction DNA helicase RuvA